MKAIWHHPFFNSCSPIDKTDYWAAQYPKTWDDDALAAGKKIREGGYSRSSLEKIVEWKSERRLKLIGDNSDSENLGCPALGGRLREEPRSAFAVLMGLRGVAVPMASAVLTAIDQAKYTLVDWRAGCRLRQSEFLSRALLPRVQTVGVRKQRQPENAR
jgi:hypothetical protein